MPSDSHSSPASSSPGGPVLLYDGACGLCNRAVRFLLRIDRRGRLRFAPLQGGPAQAWLRDRGLATSDFESLVFVRNWGAEGGGYLLRTDALVAALEACGGWGRGLAAIRVLPRPVRDAAYRMVARLRYRVFGPWRPSPLPEASWQDRFIADS
jgi:predicted DCC family thiol-disulfide oxidoreductase YuxK